MRRRRLDLGRRLLGSDRRRSLRSAALVRSTMAVMVMVVCWYHGANDPAIWSCGDPKTACFVVTINFRYAVIK